MGNEANYLITHSGRSLVVDAKDMPNGALGQIVVHEGSSHYVGQFVLGQDESILSLTDNRAWQRHSLVHVNRVPFKVRLLEPDESITLTAK